MSASDARTYVLRDDAHAQRIGALVAALDRGWVVEFKPPRRTLAQNALLHALLTEAVDRGLATDDGRRLTIEEAKVAFVSAWMIEEGHGSDIVAFGGHAVQLRRSTAMLTKDEFSSLVEFIYAACAHRAAAGKMKPLREREAVSC